MSELTREKLRNMSGDELAKCDWADVRATLIEGTPQAELAQLRARLSEAEAKVRERDELLAAAIAKVEQIINTRSRDPFRPERNWAWDHYCDGGRATLELFKQALIEQQLTEAVLRTCPPEDFVGEAIKPPLGKIRQLDTCECGCEFEQHAQLGKSTWCIQCTCYAYQAVSRDTTGAKDE